jgi:hypothetical protein
VVVAEARAVAAFGVSVPGLVAGGTVISAVVVPEEGLDVELLAATSVAVVNGSVAERRVGVGTQSGVWPNL